MPLKIAYFGLPLGAWALAQAGFVPRIICLGHPDAIGARRVRRRLSSQALILGRPDLHDSGVSQAIGSLKPDVILSWFWPKRIPESVIALAPRGAFGAHPSLLPLWRGPDPYFWAIYAGDRETGVSLHRLGAEYDTGAVIAQRRVAIADEDNAWTLAKKLDRPGLSLLVECARRLSAGESLEGAAQRDEDAIAAPEPDADTLRIVWQRPVAAILRLVRAASPEPGATTEIGGHEIEVLEARRLQGSMPPGSKPGVAEVLPEGLAVPARDGIVLLERVRTAEGEELRGSQLTRLVRSAP